MRAKRTIIRGALEAHQVQYQNDSVNRQGGCHDQGHSFSRRVARRCCRQAPTQYKQAFLVTRYHHPDLLQAIETLALQTRLLELIDACFWSDVLIENAMTGPVRCKSPEVFKMTAVELQSALAESRFAGEARNLLSWPQATGTYLGQLAQERPDRVEKARTAGSRKWLIKARPRPEVRQ